MSICPRVLFYPRLHLVGFDGVQNQHPLVVLCLECGVQVVFFPDEGTHWLDRRFGWQPGRFIMLKLSSFPPCIVALSTQDAAERMLEQQERKKRGW